MTGLSITLDPALDFGTARALLGELRAARGRPLEVDVSRVERIGGLCLQVLLAAQAAWRADNLGFRFRDPSEAFLDGINLLAADALLTAGETL